MCQLYNARTFLLLTFVADANFAHQEGMVSRIHITMLEGFPMCKSLQGFLRRQELGPTSLNERSDLTNSPVVVSGNASASMKEPTPFRRTSEGRKGIPSHACPTVAAVGPSMASKGDLLDSKMVLVLASGQEQF